MNKVEIYGNYVGNALTCGSFGQQSPGTWNGPIHYLSNICVLMRPHHVNRGFANKTWNAGEGLRYGHGAALMWGMTTDTPVGPSDLNTNVYNNTFILHDSHNESGLLLTNSQNNQGNDYFFNNVLVAVNGRVGTSSYYTGPAEINNNLYYTFNNWDPPGEPGPQNLLNGVAIVNDTDPNTDDCCHTSTCASRECGGLGGMPYIGSNPQLDGLGFGCLWTIGDCTSWYSADPSTDPNLLPVPDPNFYDIVIEGSSNDPNAHLQTHPSSWVWEPRMFIPASGSQVCGNGRGSVPSGLPQKSPVDPNVATVAYSASVIGAIPCGTSDAALNYFPVNEAWKTTSLVTNDPPQAAIASPGTSTTICQNASVYFSGDFSDSDGAPPFEFTWDFNNPSVCPSDRTELAPGNITFPNVGTCVVTFTAKDRWGEVSNGPTRTITVQTCGGGGGCSNCSQCICEQN